MIKTWNERLTREMPLTTAMQAEIDELRAKSEMDDAMLAGNGALITELRAKLAETKEALELAQLQTSSTLSKMLDTQAKLAALEVKLDAANKELDNVKQVEFPKKCEAVANGWRGKVERLEKKLAELESLYASPTCTSDEWLANCPQSMRDLADKIKAGAAPVQQVFGGRVDPSYVSGPMEEASAAKVPEEQTP